MPRTTRKVQQPPVQQSRRIRIRPAYIVLAALMALFAWKFIQKTQQIQELKAQEAALQYQNERIAQDNAHLQSSIGYYKTPGYIQEAARDQLVYTMPGEVPVVVIPRPAPRVMMRAAPAPPPHYSSPPMPVWKQWWKAFFG